MIPQVTLGKFFNDTNKYLSLSEEARELIEGMLQPDVDQRFTIEDVLDSDWVK